MEDIFNLQAQTEEEKLRYLRQQALYIVNHPDKDVDTLVKDAKKVVAFITGNSEQMPGG